MREWMKALCRRAAGGFLACFLLLSSARGATVFHPESEATAAREALALFCQCAFHPEYGTDDEDEARRLTRWESGITVWAGGSPTPQDLAALDALIAELGEKVPGLPPVRRVRRDLEAAVRIWFVPGYMMRYYIEGYVDGNHGFFRYESPGDRISLARIAVASDLTEQEERNHLILEEFVGALGLPGDHAKYSDSILYDPWSLTQSLSEVDWRMLNMLYSPAVRPGMTEAEAEEALRKELGI